MSDSDFAAAVAAEIARSAWLDDRRGRPSNYWSTDENQIKQPNTQTNDKQIK
jgi:hypothetical protein